MGYDAVLKDMKRRNIEARVAAREKQDNDAGTLQNKIFRALPIREADAVSVIFLKKLFPDEPMMRVATNVFSLFNYGRCRRIKRHDHPRHASVIHYYYWKESEGNKKVKETPVATAVAEFSVKSPEDALPKNSVFGLTTKRGIGGDKTLREKVLDELSTFRDNAINVQTIYKRLGGTHTKSSIGGTLAFLHINNYVEREKGGKHFCYWRKSEGEKEETINKHITPTIVRDEGGRGKTLRERVFDWLPTRREYAVSSSKIQRGMGGKPDGSSISSALYTLHSGNHIERIKRGRAFYYWKNEGNEKDTGDERYAEKTPITRDFILDTPQEPLSQPPIKELISKYQEDNKKLDERIANIEKQITDLGQKQELQTEMQKREENEKRLEELEEQLHKIAIADTSVKRGILH